MRRLFFASVVLVVLAQAMSGCFLFSSHGSAGDAGHEFLRDVPYRKLLIEIDYQTGKAPRSEAVQLLEQRATERLSKPDGVSHTETAFSDSRNRWTLADLRAAESAHRNEHSGLTTAVFYIQYVAGSFEADTSSGKVLGVAYGPSSLAVFKDNIDSGGYLGPLAVFSTSDVEKSVIVHEFGHILGLVNNGIPMVRPHEMTQDPEPSTPQNEGAKHSDNKNSVMYWAIDSSAIGQLVSTPPTQFDDNDIADLHAAGGK